MGPTEQHKNNNNNKNTHIQSDTEPLETTQTASNSPNCRWWQFSFGLFAIFINLFAHLFDTKLCLRSRNAFNKHCLIWLSNNLALCQFRVFLLLLSFLYSLFGVGVKGYGHYRVDELKSRYGFIFRFCFGELLRKLFDSFVKQLEHFIYI